MPSQIIVSRKLKKINDKIKDKEQHIKRPANSFMIWTQDNRTKLFNENSTLNNAEISKLLGQKWNTLSNKEKQIYKDKAEQVKKEHKRKYPDYIYRPKHKLETMTTINTNIVKPKTYMPLTININKQNQSYNVNSKMNLTINFNDNWLTYKEGYNYYEAIELFYSKL